MQRETRGVRSTRWRSVDVAFASGVTWLAAGGCVGEVRSASERDPATPVPDAVGVDVGSEADGSILFPGDGGPPSRDATVTDGSQERDSDAQDARAPDADGPDAYRPVVGPPRAFPGAVGFGTETRGGIGGRILFVTSLADDGPGTFRAACEASGPRIVLFRVSGTIRLSRHVDIRSPYLTVAAQSAPGMGVQIRGPGGVYVRTHDVVLRGLRVRVGDELPGPPGDGRAAIAIGFGPDVHHVVVDRCSLAWSTDETVTLWNDVGTTRDVTVQRTLVAETLHRSIHPDGPHSRGLIVGEGAERVAVHHTLFAHNARRNPELQAGTSTVFVNNVVYGWGDFGLELGSDGPDSIPLRADVVDNVFVSNAESRGAAIHFHIEPWSIGRGSRVFLRDNVDATRFGGDAHLVGAPWSDLEAATTPPSRVLEDVLADVGALPRDAMDARIVAQVRARSGRIIDRPADVGGWPSYPAADPEPDGDDDGIPDAWEREHGLDPRNGGDGSRVLDDGYTALEHWLESRWAR